MDFNDNLQMARLDLKLNGEGSYNNNILMSSDMIRLQSEKTAMTGRYKTGERDEYENDLSHLQNYRPKSL